MAIRWLMVLVVGLFVGSAAAEDGTFENRTQRLSYAIGMNLGNQLRDYLVEVDPEFLLRGLDDARSGGKTLLTVEAGRAVLAGMQKELKANRAALRDERDLRNEQAGTAFLAENKARDGVVTLESGLQYEILKAGDGKKPTLDDMIVAHFRGTLIDGTEFASSYTDGQPATFAVKGGVKGLGEGLQLMPTGSKWRLFIPADLAYGARGAGRNIGPNATLIVELELISIDGGPDGDPTDAAGTEPLRAENGKMEENGEDQNTAAGSGLADIKVSFKLDPRLTRSLYMGDRWISPPTYKTTVHQGTELTVAARVQGVDTKGRHMAISPEWIPADADLVSVSPGQDDEVQITVRGAGESRLNVTAQGISKELAIKAVYQGNTIKAEITQ